MSIYRRGYALFLLLLASIMASGCNGETTANSPSTSAAGKPPAVSPDTPSPPLTIGVTPAAGPGGASAFGGVTNIQTETPEYETRLTLAEALKNGKPVLLELGSPS